MTTIENVIQDNLSVGKASGALVLGALVMWRELHGIKIPRDAFRQALLDAGLKVAKDPKAEACLNAAAYNCAPGSGHRVSLKSKTADRATYALMAPHDIVNDDGRRKRDLEDAIVWIPRKQAAPALTIEVHPDAPEDADRTAVLTRLEERYNDLLRFAGSQHLSEALVGAIGQVAALSIRPGTYFVPQVHLWKIERLRANLAPLAPSLRMSIWSITDSAANRAEARTEVSDALMARVKALVSELETFAAEVPDGEVPNQRSVTAWVSRFQTLSAEAELFSDILGDMQADIRKRLTDATDRLLGDWTGTDQAPGLNTGAIEGLDQPGGLQS